MKRMVLTLLMLCFAQSVGAEPKRDGSLEEKVRQDLFSQIENIKTVELKKTTVREFEARLEGILPIKRMSCGYLEIKSVDYYKSTYVVDFRDGSSGTNLVEIIAVGDGSDSGAWTVVNARMVFVSKAGISYYHSLVPENWWIERMESKTETQPKGHQAEHRKS